MKEKETRSRCGASFLYRLHPKDKRIVERKVNSFHGRWKYWIERASQEEAQAAMNELRLKSVSAQALELEIVHPLMSGVEREKVR
jgi:hypothetical protein